MQLGLIPLEDHEADRIAVLESLREAENFCIEGARSLDVSNGKHRGNSSKANAVIDCIVHRMTSIRVCKFRFILNISKRVLKKAENHRTLSRLCMCKIFRAGSDAFDALMHLR